MIVLDKLRRNAKFCELVRLVGFHKEAAFITKYLWLNQQYFWDGGIREFHNMITCEEAKMFLLV